MRQAQAGIAVCKYKFYKNQSYGKTRAMFFCVYYFYDVNIKNSKYIVFLKKKGAYVDHDQDHGAVAELAACLA